jgi:arsenate reductase
MILYHYPKCGTSRKALNYLEEKGIKPEIRLYMKEKFDKKELTSLLELLGESPLHIIRTNNAVFKEQIKGQKKSNSELIELMLENPGIIQRAILVNKNKAVVARPIDKMEEIL